MQNRIVRRAGKYRCCCGASTTAGDIHLSSYRSDMCHVYSLEGGASLQLSTPMTHDDEPCIFFKSTLRYAPVHVTSLSCVFVCARNLSDGLAPGTVYRAVRPWQYGVIVRSCMGKYRTRSWRKVIMGVLLKLIFSTITATQRLKVHAGVSFQLSVTAARINTRVNQ